MNIERCPQCQHQLTPGDNFCASCGTSLRTVTEDDRAGPLVPDLPSQTDTSDGPAPEAIHGNGPSSGLVRQFFDHDFVSTPFVIVLQIVTLGIWPVHYMKQLTDWLNDEQPDQARSVLPPAISPEFMAANFVFAYTNAFATLLSLSDAENLSYYVFGSLISIIAFALHVVWAFKLRASLHHLWHSTFGQSGLLSSFLTFVLGVIYLNFKILGLKAQNGPAPRA